MSELLLLMWSLMATASREAGAEDQCNSQKIYHEKQANRQHEWSDCQRRTTGELSIIYLYLSVMKTAQTVTQQIRYNPSCSAGSIWEACNGVTRAIHPVLDED